MKNVHIMGIAGSGASAAASIAGKNGFKVSGCDKNLNSEFKDELGDIHLEQGHSPEHLKDVDILALSPAILALNPDNEEVKKAREAGIKVLTWEEFLGEDILQDKFVIAVSGTHGKSTTTAMIGKVLLDAGFDPTIELGAKVLDWDRNFRNGVGKYFVVEADEFNDNFLNIKPDIAVVTNIDFDHPEYFKNLDDIKESFVNFLTLTKKIIVANLSDTKVSDVLKKVMKQSGILALDYMKNEVGLNLQVPGKHNLDDANAAFQVGIVLGIDPKLIKESLEGFTGVSRRLEKIGEVNGAVIVSDFAHHPTEIKASAQALVEEFPGKKIHLIYQPHMYSRTKILFNGFVDAFKGLPISRVSIIDIYGSREKDPGDINSRMLVEAVSKEGVQYVSTAEQIWGEIKSGLAEKDVVVFMGAGDIDKKTRFMI